YVMPSATGMLSTALASMGSTGGLMGRSTGTVFHCRGPACSRSDKLRRLDGRTDDLLQEDKDRMLAVGDLAVTEALVQPDVCGAAVAGEEFVAPYPGEPLLDRAHQGGTDPDALKVRCHRQPADLTGITDNMAAHRSHDARADHG